MRFVLLAGIAAVLLAGCQSAEESRHSAQSVCHQAGLKTGSAKYQKCVEAAYQSNRRQAEQATNAAVIAGVAGIAGGAIAASGHGYYYGGYPRYYYRCRGWGC